MQGPLTTGRLFYGVAIAVYGIQQFVYGNFRNVQFPAWQNYIPLLQVWAYISGLGLIVAGTAIVLGKKGKEASLILGSFFLFLFLFVHIPYEVYGEIHSSLHFALWTDALKELALAGGAFVMAGSFGEERISHAKMSTSDSVLERIIPFGSIFFSIPMISFGIMHFMYTEHVSTLMPAWFPDPVFWTLFAAVALIGSGVAIILKIRQGAIAILLAAMLLLWVILLHAPRAIADPFVSRGNEISSTFDALAFSGIALVISRKRLRADLNEILKY